MRVKTAAPTEPEPAFDTPREWDVMETLRATMQERDDFRAALEVQSSYVAGYRAERDAAQEQLSEANHARQSERQALENVMRDRDTHREKLAERERVVEELRGTLEAVSKRNTVLEAAQHASLCNPDADSLIGPCRDLAALVLDCGLRNLTAEELRGPLLAVISRVGLK